MFFQVFNSLYLNKDWRHQQKLAHFEKGILWSLKDKLGFVYLNFSFKQKMAI